MTIISPLPNTFVDGQTADGPQVTANFNQVVANVNANAAANGANSDITSLSGLTTPLSVAQGGTGLATATANHLLTGNGTGALKDLGGTLRGYIDGCGITTTAGSGTASIAAGVAMDSTNVALMTLTALTKTTAAWSVGSGNGGLDTGVIANNTWYNFYAIERPDTGVVDVIFSLSASAPTLPANYTLYRYIGERRIDAAGHWLATSQNGDEVLLATPIVDMNAVAVSALALQTLTVPTGRIVTARIRGFMTDTAAGVGLIVCSPAESGVVAFNNPVGSATAATQAANGVCPFTVDVRTNTAAQVLMESSGLATTVSVATYGWIDTRGRNA